MKKLDAYTSFQAHTHEESALTSFLVIWVFLKRLWISPKKTNKPGLLSLQTQGMPLFITQRRFTGQVATKLQTGIELL